MNVRITFSYMVFFYFSKQFLECCYDSDDDTGVCVKSRFFAV